MTDETPEGVDEGRTDRPDSRRAGAERRWPRVEALAHPTRLAIVRRLARAQREGAALEDLAEAAGVHENTARPHVAELERAGIVARLTHRVPVRGRPPVRYRLAKAATLPTSDLLELAALLAALVIRGAHTRRARAAVARDWGRYLAGRPGSRDPASDIVHVLERLGAHAELSDDAIELTSCPCALVAPDRPKFICALLSAAADGALDACAAGRRVGAREHDPDARRCRLALVRS